MNKLVLVEEVNGTEVHINVDYVVSVAQMIDGEKRPVIGQVSVGLAAGQGGEVMRIAVKGTVEEIANLINTGG